MMVVEFNSVLISVEYSPERGTHLQVAWDGVRLDDVQRVHIEKDGSIQIWRANSMLVVAARPPKPPGELPS